MPKESLETLVAELVHEEDWRRMRATAACLAGGPRAVEVLVGALHSGTPELKREAAAMLARIKDPQAGVALVGLLEDGDEVVRKAGAAALEQMAGVLDVETASALVALLPKTREPVCRELVTHLIGAIPTAVIPLCEMMKHPDTDAQVAAATMLDHLLDPRSVDAFIDAMIAIEREAENEPEKVQSAPHDLPVRRLDDVRAAKQLDLVWKPAA